MGGRFVEKVVAKLEWETSWDLGCDGWFIPGRGDHVGEDMMLGRENVTDFHSVKCIALFRSHR